MSLLEEIGTIDWLGSKSPRSLPLLAALLICLIGGAVSAFGVHHRHPGRADPARGAVPAGREVGAVGMIIALAISSSVVDSTPFSTSGALTVANTPENHRERVFKRLMQWGMSMVLVAPPDCVARLRGARLAVIRWGIIGTAIIAQTFAADLEHTDSGTVAAVGSRRQATADEFGERFGEHQPARLVRGARRGPRGRRRLRRHPHPMHHPDALLALRAGKHALVEKPFTMNAAEAEELVAEARSRGLFLMEAMWARFLPHIREIRRLFAEGVLGDLVTVHADHAQWFEEDPEFRLFAPKLGGGAQLDLGIYPVSFASMVLGPPNRVVVLSVPAFTGVDAQTSILLGYESGAHAVLNSTLRAAGTTRAAIVGIDARIEIDGAFYQPSRSR